MSKDRCPYNSFFGEKVMIKEKLSLIWGKFVNRETISYLIFGVLTTLVDWISYAVFRHNGMNYRMATICCQAAAILFAYVTNKIWVFRSYNFRPVYLLKEMASFFSCRRKKRPWLITFQVRRRTVGARDLSSGPSIWKRGNFM